MTKRLIEIEDDLLAKARSVAGTKTIKATVETALRRLIADDTALRHVARLRVHPLDLPGIEESRRLRTTRG